MSLHGVQNEVQGCPKCLTCGRPQTSQSTKTICKRTVQIVQNSSGCLDNRTYSTNGANDNSHAQQLSNVSELSDIVGRLMGLLKDSLMARKKSSQACPYSPSRPYCP